MGNTIKNLAIIVGFIALAFGGYYIYLQNFVGEDSFVDNQQTSEDMYRQAQVVIGYRTTLNSVKMETDIFTDRRFTSLISYSSPIESQPVGRTDPFAEIGSDTN